MADVSANSLNIEDSENEVIENDAVNETDDIDVSSNDESSSFASDDDILSDPLVNDNDEFFSETLVSDPFDYSSYFENLQTIGILICSLIIAQALFLGFVLGFKK